MIGIYKITNTKNDKVYIGQSVDIDKRVKTHKRNISKIDIDTKFYRALRKYKWDNFSVEVLEECEVTDLDEREKYWIKNIITIMRMVIIQQREEISIHLIIQS